MTLHRRGKARRHNGLSKAVCPLARDGALRWRDFKLATNNKRVAQLVSNLARLVQRVTTKQNLRPVMRPRNDTIRRPSHTTTPENPTVMSHLTSPPFGYTTVTGAKSELFDKPLLEFRRCLI